MKVVEPNDEHHKARLAMLKALNIYNLEPMEMLAIMSYTVGQLIAAQDQTKVTPEMAMQLVGKNIELGNQFAMQEILNPKGEA